MKTSFYALKLDMSKAYGRIEWSFLHRVLTWFGFNEAWIRKIMFCVSSPTFSILLNGSPFGFFKASRGLRQGDPLSPYLFILCAEVLTSTLSQIQQAKMIDGLKMSRWSPQITHLLYADDVLIFGTCVLLQSQILNEVL